MHEEGARRDDNLGKVREVIAIDAAERSEVKEANRFELWEVSRIGKEDLSLGVYKDSRPICETPPTASSQPSHARKSPFILVL